MQTEQIVDLKLYGPVEAYVLATAIAKRMAVLTNGYSRNDVIEFLTLQQIAARIDDFVEQEIPNEESM